MDTTDTDSMKNKQANTINTITHFKTYSNMYHKHNYINIF
jgi:hypothetical protein